jgi:hypothetical protein
MSREVRWRNCLFTNLSCEPSLEERPKLRLDGRASENLCRAKIIKSWRFSGNDNKRSQAHQNAQSA